MNLSWSAGADGVTSVNLFLNGLSIGEHQPNGDTGEGAFHLRFRDTKDFRLPPGHYSAARDNVYEFLEEFLRRRSEELLSREVIYFGVSSDPFLPFAPKFERAQRCLEIFSQFSPGLLVVQTRSPAIVDMLPILRPFRERIVVALSIESSSERSLQRYTPGQPPVAERIAAAQELRKKGIRVNLVASPVLPYGDYYHDAWDFAAMLAENADFISCGSLASGDPVLDRPLKALPVARKLSADGKDRWMRPQAHRFLAYTVASIDSRKLEIPGFPLREPSQLSLFAA